MTEPDSIHYDGACPFLSCLETAPHDHKVCPACQTVRYGNLYCNTCRERINKARGWNLPMFTEEELDEMKIPPPVTYSPIIYDVRQLLEKTTCQSSK